MITTDAERAAYLRNVVEYLDGLPELMNRGRPDQVQLEIERIRSTIRSVLASLGPQIVRPPLEACDD